MRPSTFFAGAALAAALAFPAGRAPDAHAGELRTAAPAAATAAAAPSLDARMARLRAIPGLSAHFREEKHIGLLARPLVSEGTIHYAPPGRIARHTRTPSVSSVVLEGNTLRFGDASSEERVDLGASPVVRVFVDGFRDLLAGDRAALEKAFAIELKPSGGAPGGDAWEIVLRPRLPAITRVIKEMAFTGDGVVITRMRILETTGDEAITTFTEVDAKHAYSPAEAQQVFRLPKK